MAGEIIVLIILAAIYMLPTIIAVNRRVKHNGGIGVLNLFLGWTFIGWVIALIWAISEEEGE